ncbi:asparagine synthase (glutamine-hydrolyzing) [Alkalihalobacillus oceani]|uniref:asparagine synthase (glutamine-hydrolyzing) n=1 Tax=Halalkalibacter oceani TaxID=1653776 RepID=UPI002041C412|nr:asparagine synthase (glutamine-hydrolyzing) [Halalkalibacter oceani]MCM3763043.1 asparagine synthase (glutamine-hydrolyzing) [Halalkalibacter oceani]
MCGFVGYINNKEDEVKRKKGTIVEMVESIVHRGPDDSGYFVDKHVVFGFRRLSIIDLKLGKQPISYENNRYWMVFNGEIYNYNELRHRLKKKGYTFNTSSDSETILALFQDKKERAFLELRGMFAILIWDKREKVLYGARDPFGIKPLYYAYGENEHELYFASEKKSLSLMQEMKSLNKEALHHYLTFQYVPEPMTMTKKTYKIEPGCYFIKKPRQKMVFKTYWEPTFKPAETNLETSAKRIVSTLEESVKYHMASDVPLGAFLSGGVDSTCIVALAKEINPNIKTFTVGFEQDGYHEIDSVEQTAEALKVNNSYYQISVDEFMEELPKIIWHLDDPVADPAAIPLYFLAREAAKQVKVVLSGEGADELFGGYRIYQEPLSLRPFSKLPDSGKRMMKFITERVPYKIKGKSFIERGITPLEERYIGNARMFSEVDKRTILKSYHPDFTYRNITIPFYDRIQHLDEVTKMQYIDIQTWLRGDILVKADRMTMAHSLELRVPFLDKEVFKVAAGLHPSLKINKVQTKVALREAISHLVPEHIVNRAKLGFPVPIRYWLQNEMYDWAHDLIQSSQTEHLFEKEEVIKLLENHRKIKMDERPMLKSSFDYSRPLWTVLTFMLWHQVYIEKIYDFHSKIEHR